MHPYIHHYDCTAWCHWTCNCQSTPQKYLRDNQLILNGIITMCVITFGNFYIVSSPKQEKSLCIKSFDVFTLFFPPIFGSLLHIYISLGKTSHWYIHFLWRPFCEIYLLHSKMTILSYCRWTQNAGLLSGTFWVTFWVTGYLFSN